MSAADAFREAHALLAEEIPKVGLYYSAAHDIFFLVSQDQTTALPMPYDISGHLNELLTPEGERLNCHAGFVSWPLGDRVGE